MLRDYLPLLFFFLVAAGFAIGNLILSEWLGKRFRARGKNLPYECGMSPEETEGTRFSIHYYKVAVLFILFDIEAIFLIPWAVSAKTLGLSAFLAVLGFLFVLVVGLIYVWKSGALEWEL